MCSGTAIPSKPNFELVPLLPFARNPRFSGREAELQQLEEKLINDKRERRITVLYGLGGMGKTEIVLEFIYRFLDRYTAILWIHAATNETAAHSFVEYAQQLVRRHAITRSGGEVDCTGITHELGITDLVDNHGHLIDGGIEGQDRIRRAVIRWLSLPLNDQWLLIYDGVDDLDEIRSFEGGNYLPFTSTGTIIITSRIQESQMIGEGIEIEGLDEASSVNLLVKRYGGDINATDDLVGTYMTIFVIHQSNSIIFTRLYDDRQGTRVPSFGDRTGWSIHPHATAAAIGLPPALPKELQKGDGKGK
jgi:hypothetical protein